MSELILYLLEASAALVAFYAAYWLLLRKVTFFRLNRFFLLAILAFSFLIPLLSLDLSMRGDRIISKPISGLKEMRFSYYDAFETWYSEGRSNPSSGLISNSVSGRSFNLRRLILTIFLTIYGVGVVTKIFHLIWTYTWIYRLKSRNPAEVIDGVLVVKVSYPIAPFSFLNGVFLHENVLRETEFSQILAHEKVHIRQCHSIDLIFVQLLAAFLWFNPVVWQLIKSLKTTHEYIADKQMINQGYSLVEYQTLLLRQLISNNSYGLVHNFNLSFIKKRITMMKIKESGWAGKAKVATALSTIIVFSLVVVQCNSKPEEHGPLLMEHSTGQPGTVSLPVVSQDGGNYRFVHLSNSVNFTIKSNGWTLEGELYEIDEIASALEKYGLTEKGVIIMKVDKDQKMGLIRDILEELRKANRRKLLFLGVTENGQQVQMPMLLPPAPNNDYGIYVPEITDEYARENNIDLLRIRLGGNEGIRNQHTVYDFVKSEIKKGKSDYVVSVKYEDNDSYNDYFVNLFYTIEGFNQLYSERALEMFGKKFSDLKKLKDTDDLARKEYNAVRRGVPMAISIAER